MPRQLTEQQLQDIQEKICSFGMEYQYQMTDAEMGWLDFVRGKYSIADYLDERMGEDNIVTLDMDLSRALDDDCGGFGKAVCLDDETDLQAIFFYCYMEDIEDV